MNASAPGVVPRRAAACASEAPAAPLVPESPPSPEGVVERQHGRLALHLRVDLRLRLVQSINGAGGISEISPLLPMNSRVVLGAERGDVLHQYTLVILLAASDQRRCKRDTDAAADVAHHVDDRRGIIALRCRHGLQSAP